MTTTIHTPRRRRGQHLARGVLAGAGTAAVFAALLTAGAGPAAAADPEYRIPFGCGEKWEANTREGHNPANSIDFRRGPAGEGQPVTASADGTVTEVKDQGAEHYGKSIVIDHGGGGSTRYAHLSVQSVQEGQKVTSGQEIGKVGNTGNSQGAHLHYEQIKDAQVVKATFADAEVVYIGNTQVTSQNGCEGGDPAPEDPPPEEPADGTSDGTVATESLPLTTRQGPGTDHPEAGSLPKGAKVKIQCHAHGTEVTGTLGTSDLWDRLENGSWVPDAYVQTGSDEPVEEMCS